MINNPAPSSRLRARNAAIIGGSAAPTVTLSVAAVWSGNFLPALICSVLPVCVFICVICPAVWSRDASRRRAALAVLDRLLGQDEVKKPDRRRDR